jgi:hypothetical protein
VDLEVVDDGDLDALVTGTVPETFLDAAGTATSAESATA